MTSATVVNLRHDDQQKLLAEEKLIFNMKPKKATFFFIVLVLVSSLANCILPIVILRGDTMLYIIIGISLNITSTLLYVFGQYPEKRIMYMIMQLTSAFLIVYGNLSHFHYYNRAEYSVPAIIFNICYANIFGLAFYVFFSVNNMSEETRNVKIVQYEDLCSCNPLKKTHHQFDKVMPEETLLSSNDIYQL